MKYLKKTRRTAQPRKVRKARTRSPERFVAMIEFPAGGAQNCFPETPFRVYGSRGPGVRIERVRLYVGTQSPINGNVSTPAADRWEAVFPTIEDADDLPPQTQCRLVVESIDGANQGFAAVTFTHDPPTGEVAFLEVKPGANHILVVTGETENTDTLTVTIDETAIDANFNSATQTFSFRTSPTSEEHSEFTFRCENDDGADVTFVFDVEVDQEPPEFDPEEPDVDDSTPNVVVIRSKVQDDDSGFTDSAALQVSISNEFGTVDPGEYNVARTLSPDKESITFEITANTEEWDEGEYTATITATDVAGNSQSTQASFTVDHP